MALSVVQTVTAQNPAVNGGTALTTVAATVTATAGDLLEIVLVVFTEGASEPTLTPTSNKSGSFTAQTGISNNAAQVSGGFFLAVWTKLAAGGAETITITLGTAWTCALAIRDISTQAAAPIDLTGLGANIQTNTTYSITTGSGTAAEVGELQMLIAGIDAIGGTVTLPTGFTQDANLSVNNSVFDEVVLVLAHSTALTASTTIAAQTVSWAFGSSPGFADLIASLYTIEPLLSAQPLYPPWRSHFSHIAQ